jgi:hypothetical protein
MHASKLGTLVAILATAAGFSAFAGSAQAQISGTIGGDVVDNDAIQVYGNSDISLVDGNVAFQWGFGKTSARLTGTVHLTDASRASWRVRVDTFDRSGTLIDTAYDKVKGTPVGDKDVKDIDVDMTTPTAPFIGRVDVAVEMQGAGPKFVQKASGSTYLTLHDDTVTITSNGLDVAGPGFRAFGTPATISYKIADDGSMTATYDGVLYWDENYPKCGRVVLRSLTSTGFVAGEVDGPDYCQKTNDTHSEAQTFSIGPNTFADHVEVAMQSRVGGWGDIDTRTVSIAE